MNNFELHEQATILSDTHTHYQLARMLIETRQELEELKQKLEGQQDDKKAETGLQGTKEV